MQLLLERAGQGRSPVWLATSELATSDRSDSTSAPSCPDYTADYTAQSTAGNHDRQDQGHQAWNHRLFGLGRRPRLPLGANVKAPNTIFPIITAVICVVDAISVPIHAAQGNWPRVAWDVGLTVGFALLTWMIWDR